MSKELYSLKEEILGLEQKLYKASCDLESQNEKICELEDEIDDRIACVGDIRLVASFNLSHPVTKEELVTLNLIYAKNGDAVEYLLKWTQLHPKEYSQCPFDGKWSAWPQKTVEESFISFDEFAKRVAWRGATDESQKLFPHGWMFSSLKHPSPCKWEVRRRFGFDQMDHERMWYLITGEF